jgi:hypothetical protein
MKTYKDVIDLMETSPYILTYILVKFANNTYRWIPVNTKPYLNELKSYPPDDAFPCYVEYNSPTEDIWIHSDKKNH